MEIMKRVVAMLLCIAMCVSMVPAQAFAGSLEETVATEEILYHDHTHEEDEGTEPPVETEAWEPVEEETDAGKETDLVQPEETAAPTQEAGPGSVTSKASCSHSYTYTYSAAGHTQHTKKGTCSKCSATTSTKENHTWSGNQCSLCKCYKPITANGTYDVIATNGIQLYSENNSGSTKVKVVAKGTSITVTSVAAASSGYYWGKVTKVGTASQSTTAWVCMKSSELGTHSHSYSYSYEVTNHSQHTKKGTCTKCGATTSAKENHTWSGNKCSLCGCYKPITANGTYDVIATNGIQLYSESNSSSTKVKVVAKGTSITVTSVAATSSGYYWGKVTKVGTATQSTTAWVCMKSSELGTHSHSYSYSYTADGHSQHVKKGSCSKCGATTSANENHTWSGGKCSLCGCYEPITANGTYDVIAANGVQLYAESNSGSAEVRVVPKGTSITVTNVAATSTGYYWGKVTKVGTATQSASAWVCMKSSELGPHTHTNTKKYENINNLEHDTTTTCSGCGNKTVVRENHSWSGGKCSLCGGWQAHSTDGDYIVINESGVKLYSERITSGTSQELKTLKKGDFVKVTDVKLNDAKNYWGKVAKIGNETPSQAMYIYMGSGQISPHSHTWTATYPVHRDAWHTEQKSCTVCGYIEAKENKSHSFSGESCTLCGHAKVPNVAGDYVTFRESEALRVDIYSESDSPVQVPAGTYIYISETVPNQYGNYWGKVGSIDGKAPASTLYAYMGNLKAHKHTTTVKSVNINNVEHDTTTTCSECSYKTVVRENHTWSGGKCSICGGWQAHSTDGDYIVINESGVKLYSERITSGTSEELKTLKKGDFVKVTDVKLNDAKNYWGKVAKIGNETPSQTMYIYMGSGQISPHSHTWTATYPVHRDAWHTEQKSCTVCGYMEAKENKSHSFSGESCTLCGHAKVPNVTGDYVPYRASEPLREAPNQDSSAPEKAEKGSYLKIVEVAPNQYGNYWGKVTVVGSKTLDKALYVYMGNVTPHDHSLSFEYVTSSNINHRKVSDCACGFHESVKEKHTFDAGKCGLCGALQAYTEDGTYLVINEEGIWSYSEPITSGDSTEMLYFPKNSFLKVTGVKLNSADNYWGKVVSYDEKPAGKEMYIYMGRGQVVPHTHTSNPTYTSKSDTQHYKSEACPVCGYTQSEPTVEGHTFGSDGKCKYCGKEEVPSTPGLYVTFRTLETLRLAPSKDATEAEKLPAGTSVVIEHAEPNQYGNWWGIVESIDGAAPEKNPTYAYMGNLKPHKHTWVESFKGINNVSHDYTKACAECNLSTTERLEHNFSNTVCVDCTAWQAYEDDGDYITVKDDVPVYSKNITSPGDSRVLDSLPKGTYIRVEDVALNDADNFWGLVKRIGNETVDQEMYVYMGRGQLNAHTHSMDTVFKSKSDTQHDVNETCTVCGYTDTKPTAEDHDFDSAGVCKRCQKADFAHNAGTYVTVRESEALRADRYANATAMGSHPKGTSLEVTDVKTNKYGNWWGRVVKINDVKVDETLYTYLGNLKPHTHDYKPAWESVNNQTHKVVTACSGCKAKFESREKHDFDTEGVCKTCKAWRAYSADGGYVTVKAEGVPLYSKNHSDEGKGSKVEKTLPAGTYIEVEKVEPNDAGNYWGRVTRIGNYTEKQKLYVYMGRGQLLTHGGGDHSYSVTSESINNLKHSAEKVCTVCDYTLTVEEKHRFGTGAHNACEVCGAWEPNTEDGGYITVKEGVILYSKRSSDTKSKEMKTLPKGTYLYVEDVETNSAGNYWGKVTLIDNDSPGKKAMYVYMGTGSLETHTHKTEPSLISASDTWHVYGERCQGCAYYTEKAPEEHTFQDGVCTRCGNEVVCHEAGSYVTVRTTESLRADTYSNSKEVENVPAGTLIEVSGYTINKYGNYWGKVTKISGKSVGKKTMYTYLGNLERHASHTMKPYWQTENDREHWVGEQCEKCDHVTLTSREAHHFDGGICEKCGKAQVTGETGNYVTFRQSEPLRASASKDAKALKNVPAGTRLEISNAEENGYNNWWGIVSKIDGQDTGSKKPLYVYMGNVQRHESHDIQPFCDRKSDTQHISGLGCTVCNLTQDTKKESHDFGSDGRCASCGAEEIYHEEGGYLVKTAGNLKKDRGQDTGDVQWAAVGSYLVVRDIVTNDYGNYWGRVESIDGKKPKQAKAFVYLGNLSAHKHDNAEESYTPKDSANHTWTRKCGVCGYLLVSDVPHRISVEGQCQDCKAMIPLSTTEGAYATIRNVTFYQDKKLKEPAGIVVEPGYLIQITSVKSFKDANGKEVFAGKVGRYGDVPSGKDKLYVNMADIIPHEQHSYGDGYWSKCDLYHTWTEICTVVGCNAKNRGYEEAHMPADKECASCGKKPVPTAAGVYRVRKGDDLELYTKPISSSDSAGEAKGGSIIVVDNASVTKETGNYWAKVVWYGGKKPAKDTYVYMGSLVSYTRSASVTVSGSDLTYHYLRDGDEIFPEKHVLKNGVCEGCGMVQGTPVTGLYIVNETCNRYYKDFDEAETTIRDFEAGSILQIREIVYLSGAWYGVVSTYNGEKMRSDICVQLAKLTYHGKHMPGSEHWIRVDDKQHTYDINCPVCGINQKVKANHVFNDLGVCVFCEEAQPFTQTDCFYMVTKQTKVHKSNTESSAVLETLPRGTIVKVDTIKDKKGVYMGTGIRVMEDGQLTAHKGHIRMSSANMAIHEHSWGEAKLTAHSEADHTFTKTCTVCGLQENDTIMHNNQACNVCGAKVVVIGDYTVEDQTAVVYKDTSGKKEYTKLKEGDYVQITKIESKNGTYWGKVFRIGVKEIKVDAYIQMHCLKLHAHSWKYALYGAEDNYHIHKATCSSCGLTEQKLDGHNYDLGKCTVCGEAAVSSSTGAYVAAEAITVYKKPSKTAKPVSKNNSVAKGTHVYIREIRRETSVVQTEGDGSFYGEILWGRIYAAGSKTYSGEAWVRMSSLQDAYLDTKVTYVQINDEKHSVAFECLEPDCGLKGSTTEAHDYDSKGNCVFCGAIYVEPGEYYTTRSNAKIYTLARAGLILDLVETDLIVLAGTPAEVKDSMTFEGEQYCEVKYGVGKILDGWIALEDLADHAHMPAGAYSVIDDEYHQLNKWTETVCMVCGVEISPEDVHFAKSEHVYRDGYCKLCNIPEIPQEPGTYYAPYDGYYAYESKSLISSERGVRYDAGEEIEVEKVPAPSEGIIWGKVKETGQYVQMKTLSRTPIKKSEDVTLLTDQQVIDWCVNYDGATPFGSYGYYSEMLGTIGAADILLMSINTRASGLTDQVVKWVKEACGETLAKKYYEGQILSMLMALEEEADYSVSIPYKKVVKEAIKLSKTGMDWQLTYNGKLKDTDIAAIKKLKANMGKVGSLLDKGELGLEILSYMAMDFGRMQGVIEAARAIQAESVSDPDLKLAFEDVILTYENKYYQRNDQIVELMLDIMAEQWKDEIKWYNEEAPKKAAALIKKVTGFDVAKGWSDWGFVYATVNLAVDLGMTLTGGAKYSDAMLTFMSQISVMSASSNAYTKAVNRIKAGDHSSAAVSAVRLQFAAYKVSMVELYDAMLAMASSHLLNIGEDDVLISYLQFEKNKLESIYLVNDASKFVMGISLATYKRTHGV